ncbi:hypothetical protein ACFL2B_02985 [Patescibacteria group bacterium]
MKKEYEIPSEAELFRSRFGSRKVYWTLFVVTILVLLGLSLFSIDLIRDVSITTNQDSQETIAQSFRKIPLQGIHRIRNEAVHFIYEVDGITYEGRDSGSSFFLPALLEKNPRVSYLVDNPAKSTLVLLKNGLIGTAIFELCLIGFIMGIAIYMFKPWRGFKKSKQKK